MKALLLAALAAALVASCAPTAPTTAPSEKAAAETGCADDGARLPITGICVGRASNYYEPERLMHPPTTDVPAGCAWTFTETAIGDGSEAIVYRALRCGETTTKLSYSAGARYASLSTETSAFGPQAAGGERVRIFVSDPADPQKVIRDMINALPPAERAKCVVQPAKIESWPPDALVIGYNEAAARTLPRDEPNAVCGDYGLDEDQTSYWIVRQGFAYYFNLGQDAFEIDPETFLRFRRGADGSWAPVE